MLFSLSKGGTKDHTRSPTKNFDKENQQRVILRNERPHKNFDKELRQRKFTVEQPGRAWVSDITYIRIIGGFLYLTIILDLFDRKIIGWNLSASLTSRGTTIPAWEMAINNRKITNELIFHSDRGVQYANKSFRTLLNSYKSVTRSMSNKGNYWDNAVAESFFNSLKVELIYKNKILPRAQMEIEIFDYIEGWYNKKRRHSYLNYQTIEEFDKFNNLI